VINLKAQDVRRLCVVHKWSTWERVADGFGVGWIRRCRRCGLRQTGERRRNKGVLP
jgi:hypothetical protein